jgi:hypothetical protein
VPTRAPAGRNPAATSADHEPLPGGPERKKVLADAFEKRKDRDLARKFARLALAGLDHQIRRKQVASIRQFSILVSGL